MQQGIVIFDIDGVVRDVSQSYRRAIADTVEHYTQGQYRPTMADIDQLKSEGIWNNDWQASHELITRWNQTMGKAIDYAELVDYFQSRYRGNNFDGYITSEPLLMTAEYLTLLSTHNLGWGFFSGATRGSAEFVLKKRLRLEDPVLIAMDDAPGKPDPTGLFAAIAQLESTVESCVPVAYVGDTVADMHTIRQAMTQQPNRLWRAVGILPPHVQTRDDTEYRYASQLEEAGADIVLPKVTELIPEVLRALF